VGSPLSCGDVLVHHAIALGLHTTVLVLLKAALNGRSSKLMPDKGAFGYGFPCDGPGRGGTCDIPAWDGFYLAAFWMLSEHAGGDEGMPRDFTDASFQGPVYEWQIHL
jgi:photosystem I P700 chlorophyll a apoprotein A2